ncbi:ABC transporter substrate-binding protein [Falsiroseomonas sp. HW251]|uniref:ABC transporter substrate-binding protein n=1 Tax=Falsiroseomonas sp. HW251 TaxID=3390998 RepID=UPI003D3200F3
MRRIGLAMTAAALATTASAADFTFALQTDTTSMDPHVAPTFTASALHAHVFDTLVTMDPRYNLRPSLATSWRPVSDTAWEFELRPGVTFADGRTLTAEDVAFSFSRVLSVRFGAGTYAPYARSVSGVTVLGPHRVRLETAAPYPQLLLDVERIRIVSAGVGDATTVDFNQGRAAIGTGPFRLVRWTPGEKLEFTRNPTYWGPPPVWDNVTMRPIPNDAARLAALLSGTVDLIDKVPMTDVARLRGDSRVTIYAHDGNRTMFLVPDTAREVTPFVTDKEGRPLDRNPLRDVRVRQAMSLAINRAALTERAMDGLATPANQVAPEGMFGFADGLPRSNFDPIAARRLLAEAGFPNGFRITLHCSNGRYVNDRTTCLQIVQMLSRIGIDASAEAEPQSVFLTRMTAFNASLLLNGWGSTGDNLVVLRQAVHSVDPAGGWGGFNRGRYSNPGVDRLIEQASQTLDDTRRAALQAEAMQRAMEEVGLVPLYTAQWIWATRRGFTFTPGFDEGTLAVRAAPVN